MKIEKRFFLSYRYKAILLLLCFVVLLQCSCTKKEPEKEEQKQATGYDRILEYLPEGDRENVRLQTEEEQKAFPALWPSVPIEENAAFYYMRAISFLSADEPPLGSVSNKGKYDEKTVREWVDKNKKALVEMKKALKFNTCEFPLLIGEEESFDHQLMGISPALTYFSGLRQLARECSDVGFVAELDGNNDEATEWYLACLKMGEQISKDSTLIENLVGIAISHIGYGNLRNLVANAPISDQLLTRIIAECHDAEVEAEEMVRIFEKEMESEVWLYSDKDNIKEMREQYSQSQEGEDALTKSIRSLARMSNEEYKKFLADIPSMYNELQNISRAPLTELVKPDFDLESKLSEKFRSDVFKLLYDIYNSWFKIIGRESTSLRALQIRAAIALYQKENDKPPESLEDLCPKWLPDVPVDPFSGKPMKYKKEDNKWFVYSVGEDGKDDRGQGTSWQGKPDIVFKSEIQSNIERRKEWGERYSALDE